MSSKVIKPIIERLMESRRIVVTAHARPDGDALGSALALARVLRRRGKEAVVALDRDEVGVAALLLKDDELWATASDFSGFDLMVVLDCGSSDRMPAALVPWLNKLESINVDHHPTNTYFGGMQWVESGASSCGEMVWRLTHQAGWELDRDIAEALWVAIMTDTGRFSYESTSAETMRCAADLLEYGVRTAWLNEEFYLLHEWRAHELKKLAYQTLELWREGDIAVVSLSYGDFVATGCSKADADDIIEIPRSVRGSRVALFLYETEENATSTRVSIRTRAPLDAIKLARRYDGGGHVRAAGATIPGGLRQARTALRLLLESEPHLMCGE